jgi:2-keto-4-pentenoate hydratase/2-oxohepta-3-ene-1,7-dioic acid hydratase in catechol pathway
MKNILRLCTFSRGETSRVGVLLADGSVLDTKLSQVADKCTNMQSIIDSADFTLKHLNDFFHSSPSQARLAPHDVKILAPIPRPARNVFCVGKNYLDHVNEINKKVGAPVVTEPPKYAQFFTKAPECVIATGDHIQAHVGVTKWLDYEVELGVVIGKQGKNITKEQALDYVFGWTIGNDVSARDLQKNHVQFFKGKTLDSSCPMGPCIVPKQYLDVSDISLKLWVNGDLRQNGSTRDMIFNVPEIIRQLSAGFTLKPGDIILTGTPSGVGYAMQPPQTLKPGDNVKIEVQGIGELENLVV